MKIKLLLPILLSFSVLASCGGKEDKPYYFIETKPEETVTSEVYFDSHNSTHLTEPFTYSDKYFDDNFFNGKLNLSLARVGFGVALSSTEFEINKHVFSDFGYLDITSYEHNETYDGAFYVFGHKKIADRNMILVSIRSSEYKEEWASNFNIGNSGDHAGFSTAAHLIIDSLKEYLTKYNLIDNPKIWITGFSRGAGISNLLGKYVYNDSFFMMEENDHDLYVTAYETPKCAVDDGKKYPFVVNICNSDDFVIRHPTYDFITLGNTFYYDKYIDSKKADEYCHNLEKEYPTPYFFPKKINIAGNPFIVDDYDSNMTLNDFYDLLMKAAYCDTSSLEDKDKYLDISTREKYMDSVFYSVSYLLIKAFSLSEANLKLIIDYYSSDMSKALSILQILMSDFEEKELYDLLVEVFDVGQIDYEVEELTKVSEQLTPYIKTVKAIMGSSLLNNLATIAGNFYFIRYKHQQPLVYSYLNVIE